ncbi:MAG: hypothetical protein ACFFCS_16405 [Candidatus Hodarchaeota archaeon]
MGWTPPNRVTVMFATMIIAAGFALGIGGYNKAFDPHLLTLGGIDTNDFFVFLGIIMPACSWALLFAGVKSNVL